jgi:hypothetical protein
VCVLVGSLSGLRASSELFTLRHLSEVELTPMSTNWPMTPELSVKAGEVVRASLFGMRSSRMAVLGLLSMTCTVAFITGIRLWKPLGLPRAGLLGPASWILLVCALLRVVDGAQQMVTARRVGTVLAEGFSRTPPEGVDPEMAAALAKMMPHVTMGVDGLLTLFVAGTFVILSQYFRSPRARELFTAGDPVGP